MRATNLVVLWLAVVSAGAAPATRSATPPGAATKPAVAPATQPAPAAGGAVGPIVHFRAIGGPPVAKRIVFVCDASGVSAKSFPTLQEQLGFAIGGLKPDQQFDVVFYVDGKAVAGSEQLQAATPDNKRAALRFVDGVKPRGSRDPLPAVRRAAALKPDLIYLAVCGGLGNGKPIVAEMDKLNPRHEFFVNTILVDEHDEATERTLMDIARQSGGIFKFVTRADLDEAKGGPTTRPAR